jgi:hypothetical protein
VKVAARTDRTHNPSDEAHWVSRLRENLTSGSDGEGLETGRWRTLAGHERGNPGHRQGQACYTLPRQSFTRQLDLRNIKTTLGMEHLRCKTPEMAIKELWVYLLAYNLIRLLMAQAALLADQIPRQLSFKHTVQIWMAWQQRGGGTHDAVSINALLVLIAEPRVGLRPGRIEPRALKRRPKAFALLTKPRPTARAEVRENGHLMLAAE